MLRSISSIATGFVAWLLPFLGSTALLRLLVATPAAGEGPPRTTGVLVLTLGLSLTFSVLAGWITFRVDRIRALGSSLILGVLLLAVGIAMQARYWQVQPLWYHLSFLGALVPGVLVGYRLAVTRS